MIYNFNLLKIGGYIKTAIVPIIVAVIKKSSKLTNIGIYAKKKKNSTASGESNKSSSNFLAI